MENTKTFEVTLNVRECAETDDGYLTASGAEALEEFAEVLKAYGMVVESEYTPSGKRAKIKIWHPEANEAKKLRNRGGGRHRKNHDYNGLTLEWFESHSIEEGMQALGNVSRRTYYRRINELKNANK